MPSKAACTCCWTCCCCRALVRSPALGPLLAMMANVAVVMMVNVAVVMMVNVAVVMMVNVAVVMPQRSAAALQRYTGGQRGRLRTFWMRRGLTASCCL